MIDVLLNPMFDSRVTFLDLPQWVVIMGVGVAMNVVGLVWLRRTTTPERDYKSFRATTRREPIDLLTRAALAAGITFVAVLGLVTLLAR